jgi:hypothetical protein
MKRSAASPVACGDNDAVWAISQLYCCLQADSCKNRHLKAGDAKFLARPPAADPRVKSLCSEFDIEIVPAHVYPLPGQTRAPTTIRRIDKHGIEHGRLVLSTISETAGNQGLLDEVSLWTVSDLS